MAKKVLFQNVSIPFENATLAKINIDPGDGNLAIDRLADGDHMLASGTLQYLEKQDPPTQSTNTIN